MPFHFLVWFEPASGADAEFRDELRRVAAPTRAEPGCLGMQVFEAVRPPVVFAIHSVWVDEAAFEAHARLPHTMRFVAAAERLQGRPIQGLRLRPLDETPAPPAGAA